MGVRIQFLDRNAETIKELYSSARTAADALALVKEEDWPLQAIRLVVRNSDGLLVAEKSRHSTPGFSRR